MRGGHRSLYRRAVPGPPRIRVCYPAQARPYLARWPAAGHVDLVGHLNVHALVVVGGYAREHTRAAGRACHCLMHKNVHLSNNELNP